MAAFKNLFGLKEKKPAFPVVIEIIPEKLTATVDLVDIQLPGGPLSCWSYTTQGYNAYGQKEMVFLFARGNDTAPEAYSMEPIEFFRTFEPFARKGETVNVGSVTEFGGPGPFGRQIVYFAPQAVKGLSLPADVIVPFLITSEEAYSIEKYGPTRFMARLGQSHDVFPYPIWSDLRRPPVTHEADLETLLERVERIPAKKLIVYQEGEAIFLRNAYRPEDHFADDLPMLAPLAFLTALDPRADSCLVWQTGQGDPQAIIQPGTNGDHLCGCFLLIVPGHAEDQWQILEDGFAWMLTQQSWQGIRSVLAAGKSLKATMTGERLSFAYLNPR